MAWVAISRATIEAGQKIGDSVDSGFEESDYINIPNDPDIFDQRLARSYRYVLEKNTKIERN